MVKDYRTRGADVKREAGGSLWISFVPLLVNPLLAKRQKNGEPAKQQAPQDA
jgi:hypothetical protein